MDVYYPCLYVLVFPLKRQMNKSEISVKNHATVVFLNIYLIQLFLTFLQSSKVKSFSLLNSITFFFFKVLGL